MAVSEGHAFKLDRKDLKGNHVLRAIIVIGFGNDCLCIIGTHVFGGDFLRARAIRIISNDGSQGKRIHRSRSGSIQRTVVIHVVCARGNGSGRLGDGVGAVHVSDVKVGVAACGEHDVINADSRIRRGSKGSAVILNGVVVMDLLAGALHRKGRTDGFLPVGTSDIDHREGDVRALDLTDHSEDELRLPVGVVCRVLLGERNGDVDRILVCIDLLVAARFVSHPSGLVGIHREEVLQRAVIGFGQACKEGLNVRLVLALRGDGKDRSINGDAVVICVQSNAGRQGIGTCIHARFLGDGHLSVAGIARNRVLRLIHGGLFAGIDSLLIEGGQDDFLRRDGEGCGGDADLIVIGIQADARRQRVRSDVHARLFCDDDRRFTGVTRDRVQRLIHGGLRTGISCLLIVRDQGDLLFGDDVIAGIDRYGVHQVASVNVVYGITDRILGVDLTDDGIGAGHGGNRRRRRKGDLKRVTVAQTVDIADRQLFNGVAVFACLIGNGHGDGTRDDPNVSRCRCRKVRTDLFGGQNRLVHAGHEGDAVAHRYIRVFGFIIIEPSHVDVGRLVCIKRIALRIFEEGVVNG